MIIADPDHKYYEGWGTSAAAAFVSGPPPWSGRPTRTWPRPRSALLEDTARNAPRRRDDSRGFGFIDRPPRSRPRPRMEPEGLESAAYGEKYFGPGPDTAGSDDDTADWAAPWRAAPAVCCWSPRWSCGAGRRTRYDAD
ncbi:hypothetical protein GCM10023238_33140 [Streptomyces heliomycini]